MAVTRGRALVGTEVCDVIDTPRVNVSEGTLTEDEHITRRVLENGEADHLSQRVLSRSALHGRGSEPIPVVMRGAAAGIGIARSGSGTIGVPGFPTPARSWRVQ